MNIFVNPDDRRLRAGWRIILQLILFMLLVTCLMIANSILFSGGSLKLYDALLMGFAGILSVWVAARAWDKRPLRDYGLSKDKRWFKELAFGLALGMGAMVIIFAIEWAAGWIEITGFGWDRSTSIPYALWFFSYFIAMVIIGFYEELIFRGYQMVNLVEGFQSKSTAIYRAALIAVAVSSIIFGLLHFWNPNATVISTVNIIFAGIMLAIPYLVTGSIAISVGIHISWNFVQGGLLGFPVSGTAFRGSLIQIRQAGDTYLTGGSFGPEAGLLGIFGMLFILTIFLWYARTNSGGLAVHSSFKNGSPKSANQDE